MMFHWLTRGALAGVAAVALAAGVACGGDDEKDEDAASTPVAEDTGGGAVSPGVGMVAQNVFLTFEGRKYRLDNLAQADLIDESGFSKAGTTEELDIDHSGAVDVYTKADDAEAVWTRSEGSGTDKPFWYRWKMEP